MAGGDAWVVCAFCARRPARLGRLDYCEACAALRAGFARCFGRGFTASALEFSREKIEDKWETTAETYRLDTEYQRQWRSTRLRAEAAAMKTGSTETKIGGSI